MLGTDGELILNLHGTGEIPRTIDPGEMDCWLSAAELDEVLDYAVTTCPATRITFDDGNVSDIQVALPALLSRGLRATFFVLSGRLKESHFLSRSHLRELVASGMGIGTHGCSHRPWRHLSAEDRDAELFDAKRDIEDAIGIRVNEAACPFGVYCRETLNALRAAGIARVFTSDRGWASRRKWLQPRNTLHRGRAVTEAQLAYHDRHSFGSVLRNCKMVVKSFR